MTRSEIAKTAWQIARKEAAILGTSVRAQLSVGMRRAWAKHKILAGRSLYDARRIVSDKLERLAQRCHRSDAATDRQTGYLAALMLDAGDVLTLDSLLADFGFRLSRRDASAMIDALKG